MEMVFEATVINFELSDSLLDLSVNADRTTQNFLVTVIFTFLCSDGLEPLFCHVTHIEQNFGQLPKHFVDLLSPGLDKSA